MTLNIYDVSVPVFVNGLTDMSAWLDKVEKDQAELMAARLAPDMRPFPSQYQIASDTAKLAIARLADVEAPPMEDNEASFDELRDRCQRTIDFIKSVDPERLQHSAGREITLRFGKGTGYKFNGLAYLTGFAIPNFLFHVTTAYAILRANGVEVGKHDFLQHLGTPSPL